MMTNEKEKRKENDLSRLFELIKETCRDQILSISIESHAYNIWITIGVLSTGSACVYHNFELDGMQSNLFITLWDLLRSHIIAFKKSELTSIDNRQLWKLKKV